MSSKKTFKMSKPFARLSPKKHIFLNILEKIRFKALKMKYFAVYYRVP